MWKKSLLTISAVAIMLVLIAMRAHLQVRATAAEAARILPGDDLIQEPIGSVNRAIAIRHPSQDVWPWLVQMGSVEPTQASRISTHRPDVSGITSVEDRFLEHVGEVISYTSLGRWDYAVRPVRSEQHGQ